MAQTGVPGRRAPLSRERVLHAAVALADEGGVESLSMRKLSQKLDVVPMALYKHVANKEELLDGMVEVIVSEIDTRVRDENWKNAVRLRILSAREGMLRHRWASQVIESRTHAPPVVLEYMDSLIRLFRAGDFRPTLPTT
ncbi:TetR family transcriptional regulator [Arthrobacter sp. SA17]